MFSARVPDDFTPNRLTAILQQRRAQQWPIVDLTVSNPTHADLPYAGDLLAALASPAGLHYRPQAMGLSEARMAVADDYARRGLTVPAERIALTASTSEAYSLLFKVLCEPGDEVLVPHPSYPLFEHLTRLDAVTAVPYDLEYHGSWSLNIPLLTRLITPRTRAVLIVSPNNPTGSYLKVEELRELAAVCGPRGIALIVDEVFADYRLPNDRDLTIGHAVTCEDALAFSLGGLSKSIGLPQAKLGWIALGGPSVLVNEALARLEFVCDTYLSVSTPVQLAASTLLTRGAEVREAIQRRIVANFRRLHALAPNTPSCRVLDAEGGWYAVLQVPTFATEEDLVLELLSSQGIVVHPGYFFDFPRESFLVLSLLTPPDTFDAGVTGILRHFDCRAGDHGGHVGG